jgi:pyridoxamine 5'-phosphate oxidase
MDHPEEFTRLLMEVADRAYLTTMGEDGYPRTRAILNLRNPALYPNLADLFDEHREDFLVYVGTNTSSAKVRQIQRDPRGSIYYCHPKRFRGVLLIGEIELVDDPSVRHALWTDGWEIYYPSGRDDPDYAVLRFLPHSMEGWSGSERFGFAVGAA